MPTVCSCVVNDFHVYYRADRVRSSLKFEVYKIDTPTDVDPAPVYAAFKTIAADLFRAEVSFPKLDAPVVAVDETPTEETPSDSQTATDIA